MIKVIAIMSEIHSEYDWEISFNLHGDKYYVNCRWLEGDKYNHKIKNFDTKEAAVCFWNQQTLNILDGLYSLEDRIKQFE